MLPDTPVLGLFAVPPVAPPPLSTPREPAPLRLVLQPWGKVIELNQSEVVIGRHRLYFLDLPAISGVRYRHAAETGTA